MTRIILSILLCSILGLLKAQIPVSSSIVSTYAQAAEGDLYQDENSVVYIGMQNGSLRRIHPDTITSLQLEGSRLLYVDERGDSTRLNINATAGYEKIVIWAEEGGGLSDNNLQWSFGNGAVGLIGIPLPEDWEAYAVSFNADNSSGGATSVEMAVINTVNNANLFTFTASGVSNNMVYTEVLAMPVQIPAGTSIGFRTVNEVGSISDARVAVWLRRLSD